MFKLCFDSLNLWNEQNKALFRGLKPLVLLDELVAQLTLPQPLQGSAPGAAPGLPGNVAGLNAKPATC